MRTWISVALSSLILSASATVASAQQVTLKGITSFAEKTFYSRAFEKFVE
jgi:hypothetical protein